MPEKAPFFLPTLPGVEHRFAIDEDKKKSAGKDDASGAKGGRRTVAGVESEFQRRLLDEDESGDCTFSLPSFPSATANGSQLSVDEKFFVYMKALSPAAVDLELRSLADVPETETFFLAFLNALTARLKTHRDFEAVQTFLAVFLRLHGASILETGGQRTSSGRRGLEESDDEEDEDAVYDALQNLAEVQQAETERVLELVASSLGTLSFVRDTM